MTEKQTQPSLPPSLSGGNEAGDETEEAFGEPGTSPESRYVGNWYVGPLFLEAAVSKGIRLTDPHHDASSGSGLCRRRSACILLESLSLRKTLPSTSHGT